MGNLTVALTFDVDCQSYLEGRAAAMADELDRAFEVLGPLFERHPSWRASWFLRIDPGMHAFDRQAGLLRDRVKRGDRLGWHFHGPLKRVSEFARHARAEGLDLSRIGFGRASNRVMRALAAAGFGIDSTAMPRPIYKWTRRGVDWTTTPDEPYHPSMADYRVPGEPALPILEVPISCGEVLAPDDNQKVVRYLNPAYHQGIFEAALSQWVRRHAHLVTITHPYEVLRGPKHGLLAFDPHAFEENVVAVERVAAFRTLSGLAGEGALEVASA